MSQFSQPRQLFTGAQIKQFPITFVLGIAIASSYFLSFSAWIETKAHDDQRLLQTSFILLAGVVGLVEIMRQRSPRLSCDLSLKLFFSLFFLFGAYSSMRAFSSRHAFYEEASLLMMLLFSMYIADEVSRARDRSLDLVLRLCAAGCLLYSFKFLVIYVLSVILLAQPDLVNLIAGFSNYRFFNHTQTITLPLLVLLYATDRRKKPSRMSWLLLTAFWWALLLMTGGRGTMLGIAAGVAAAGLAQGKNARHFCKAALVTGVAGLGAYIVLFLLIPLGRGMEPIGLFLELGQRSIENPTSSRTLLWQRALELIYSHPWFGVGPMHFAHNSMDVMAGAHPHNLVLQIAAEWGLPALLCLLAAIALLMRGLLRTIKLVPEKDTRNQAVLTAWIVASVAILVDSQFSGLTVMPLSYLLIVLFAGCAAGWVHSYAKHGIVRGRPPLWQRKIEALLVLVSLAGILNGVWPGIESMCGLGPRAADISERSDPVLRPRLWVDGFF